MTEAKKERKPTKKFYVFDAESNTVNVGLTTKEVVDALSANESLKVYDQISSECFNLYAPLANDKFKKQTVISYHE